MSFNVKKTLILCLLMASVCLSADVFGTKDSVFWVGGKGAKTGDALAGGATQDWVDSKGSDAAAFAAIMGPNGVVLVSSETGEYEAGDDPNKIMAVNTDGVETGMVVYLEDVSGGGSDSFDTGRYEITAISPSGVGQQNGDITCSGITGPNDLGTLNNQIRVRIGGAFDSIHSVVPDEVDGSNFNVEVLTNLDESPGEEFEITCTGSPTNNTWVRLIGVDDSGVELTKGNYVTWDGRGEELASGAVNIGSVDNIEIRNVWVRAVTTPATADYGIFVSSAGNQYNYSFINCKLTDATHGIITTSSNKRNAVITDCEFDDVTVASIYWLGYGASIFDNKVVADNTGIIVGLGSTITRNEIVGGITGIIIQNMFEHTISNNTIYGQSGACIDVGHANAGAVIYNNILWVDNPATSYAILLNSGSILYEDYNYTNSTNTSDNIKGDNSLTGVTDAQIAFKDPPDDLSLLLSSIAINSGKPPVNGESSTIGAWQPIGNDGSGGDSIFTGLKKSIY